MRKSFCVVLQFFAVLVVMAATRQSHADEISRRDAFIKHQKYQESFSRYRDSGADIVRKARKDWEEARLRAADSYKKWKDQQSTSQDESGPEYKEYLRKKRALEEEHIKASKEYSLAQERLRSLMKKSNLSEEEEFGLVAREAPVDSRKRKFGSGGSSGSGGVSSGNSGFGGLGDPVFPSSGNTDFNNGNSFNQPPQFYEAPDGAPAPIPSFEGGFDDPVPPPLFDDPGDF